MSVTEPNSDAAPGIGDNSGLTEEELAAWADEEGAAATGEGGEEAGAGEGEPQEIEAEAGADDEPPEFWAAERKALWAKVTDPELKAAIRGHVDDVSKGIAKKLEESAAEVRQAKESAKGALDNQNQLAAWWQQNGPRIQVAMLGKWARVDWNKLATEDPGAYVRARQEFENDQGFVRDLTARHQAEVQRVEQQRIEVQKTERVAEHAKLAQKYPDEFGPAKAQETYDALSDYLLKQGISSDRLAGIYEAPVVEIVRKAYRYDQLQAKAKDITEPKPAASASTTPKRLVPGPASAGNRPGGASRQAIQRLSTGQNLSDDDVAELFG